MPSLDGTIWFDSVHEPYPNRPARSVANAAATNFSEPVWAWAIPAALPNNFVPGQTFEPLSLQRRPWRPPGEYTTRVIPKLEDVNVLGAWLLSVHQPVPRPRPRPADMIQGDYLAALTAQLAPDVPTVAPLMSQDAIRPRAALSAALRSESVYPELANVSPQYLSGAGNYTITGLIGWLGQDLFQPRRPAIRNEGSILTILPPVYPDLALSSDMTIIDAAIRADAVLPAPRRRPVVPGMQSDPINLFLTDPYFWPVLDAIVSFARKGPSLGPQRPAEAQPPLDSVISIMTWPTFDQPIPQPRLRVPVRTGDTSGRVNVPDADLVLQLGWFSPTTLPGRRPTPDRSGFASGGPWFDQLMIDVLLPQWLAVQPRIVRPGVRLAGESVVPPVVKTDSAQYVVWAPQQDRPRVDVFGGSSFTVGPVNTSAAQASASALEIGPSWHAAVFPAVGGPYTVVVGWIFQAGATAGFARSD